MSVRQKHTHRTRVEKKRVNSGEISQNKIRGRESARSLKKGGVPGRESQLKKSQTQGQTKKWATQNRSGSEAQYGASSTQLRAPSCSDPAWLDLGPPPPNGQWQRPQAGAGGRGRQEAQHLLSVTSAPLPLVPWDQFTEPALGRM